MIKFVFHEEEKDTTQWKASVQLFGHIANKNVRIEKNE
jgi:hypothetical protein